MSRRVLCIISVTVFLWSSAIRAQQGQGPGAPADNPARQKVFVFEMALRSAVDLAGQKLAQQMLSLVPEIKLAVSEQPIVRGIQLTSRGFFFDVQAPDIRSTLMVFDMLNQSPGRIGGPRPSLPVAEGRIGATGGGSLVDDPVVTAPAAFNPDRVYTTHIHDFLLDALLDSSGVLALGDDETLWVAADRIDGPDANPLIRSRKLVLSVKGADLHALRQGKISRDEAKARVVQERF